MTVGWKKAVNTHPYQNIDRGVFFLADCKKRSGCDKMTIIHIIVIPGLTRDPGSN